MPKRRVRRKAQKGLVITKKTSRRDVLRWSNQMIKKGASRQQLCDYLLKTLRQLPLGGVSSRIYAALLAAESALFNEMVERNSRGRGLERDGRLSEAIALYEANVRDEFSGSAPYDRLRIIYTKQKDYDSAIRVCHQFVDIADARIAQGSGPSGWIEKRKKFKECIKKLEDRKKKVAAKK